jgi:hypothetical protein
MKQEEIHNPETKKMLLSAAIFETFGEQFANLLQDNYAFILLEPNKIGVKTNADVTLNDIEKAKMRKCIKSVYGENVKIVSTNNTKSIKTDEFGNNRDSNPLVKVFRANLMKSLLEKYEEKYAQHIIKNWFDKLCLSEKYSNHKLVLVGSTFVLNWIEREYLLFLEKAALHSNFLIELHYQNNLERPIVFLKKAIVTKIAVKS